MDKNNRKFIQLFEALTDALGRSDGQSIEEVEKDLVMEGIDLKSSMKRLKEGIHKSSMAAKRSSLDLAQAKRMESETKRNNLFGKYTSWTRDKLMERLKEIIALQSAAPSTSFRDLENKSTEDLASLLEDLETLQGNNKGNKRDND